MSPGAACPRAARLHCHTIAKQVYLIGRLVGQTIRKRGVVPILIRVAQLRKPKVYCPMIALLVIRTGRTGGAT